MAENAAAEQMDNLLADLEQARDAGRFEQIFDERITSIGPTTDKGGLRAPGFSDDAEPGIYYNGWALWSKAADGTTWYVEQHHAMSTSTEIERLWTEMDQERRRRDDFAREAVRQQAEVNRRGRPEIGRAVEVRLPDWQLKTIDAYAERHDLKRAEALRQAIHHGLMAMQQMEKEGRNGRPTE